MIMALLFEDFIKILQEQLTPEERATGVVYAAESLIAAGTRLQFAGTVIDVPAASRLAFIDRDPMANWGHSARYLLIGYEDGAILSYESRRPPFQTEGDFRWQKVYQAPAVPDAAVAFPQQTRQHS